MIYDLLSTSEKQEKLVDLLGDFLGPSRSHYSNKSQIAFDCPHCSSEKGVTHDHKGNLEINYKIGKFNCWACGEHSGMHGDLYKLFLKWSSKEHLQAFKTLNLGYTYINKDGEEKTFGQKDKEAFKLPAEYISLSKAPYLGAFKPYFDYLTKRRITKEIIDKYQIGCCMEGKYWGRVVLPSYNEFEELNYFVTRAISPKVRRMKYLNCEENKQLIIFNEHLIDWEKWVFIVEGPFDHIVLPNSIPLLGKQLSPLLFKTLYENAESNVVLILDPDAWERTVQIYNKLDGGKLMGRVFACKMPRDENGKDIDVSLFNELYGQKALFEYIQKNTVRLLD